MNKKIIFILGFCFGILFIFCFAYLIEDFTEDKTEDKIIEDYRECINLSLEDTSFCLRDYIKGFYKYAPREDTIKSLENIKKYGGDCMDWNFLLGRLGAELGFNSNIIDLKIEENKMHTIAIISDETGYCLLDQLQNPSCYEIEIPLELEGKVVIK